MVPNALCLEPLIRELQNATEFQSTVRVFEYLDYLRLVHDAIRRLFVDTARASVYSEDLFVYDSTIKKNYFDYDIKADEYEYILIVAKLKYYDIVNKEYIDMVSYSTNALTVANGEKPYKNFKALMDALEEDRRKVYYSMTRFWVGDI